MIEDERGDEQRRVKVRFGEGFKESTLGFVLMVLEWPRACTASGLVSGCTLDAATRAASGSGQPGRACRNATATSCIMSCRQNRKENE